MIKKYKLAPVARQAIAVELPVAAQIFGVGHKAGGPCFWAIGCVEPTWPKEIRRFVVLPTDEVVPFEACRLQHIGSYWKEERQDAWHMFEILDESAVPNPLEAKEALVAAGTAA